MLILDQGLIERIDENRGDLSRAEFVELCIDNCFDGVEPEKEGKHAAEREFATRRKEVTVYVTEEEFQEFKRGIKDVLKAFLDFFVSLGLNLGDRGARRSVDDLRWRVREALGEEDFERPKSSWRPGHERYYDDEYDDNLRPSRQQLVQRFRQRIDRALEAEDFERPKSSWRPGYERYYDDEYDDNLRPSRRQLVRDLRRRVDYTLGEEELEPPRSSRRPRRERYYPEEYDEPPQRPRGLVGDIKRRFQTTTGVEEPVPSRSSWQPRGKRYYSEEHVSHPPVPRYPRREISYLEDVDDVPSEPPSEGKSHNMYAGLWIPAIALFGFGDTLLSTMVFAKGGYEANPLMGGIVSMFGGSMVAFVIIKTVILILLAFISFKVFRNHGWVIPSILSAVGAYLVFTNGMALLSLS